MRDMRQSDRPGVPWIPPWCPSQPRTPKGIRGCAPISARTGDLERNCAPSTRISGNTAYLDPPASSLRVSARISASPGPVTLAKSPPPPQVSARSDRVLQIPLPPPRVVDAKTPSWRHTDFGPSDPRDIFIQVHRFSIDPFCSIRTRRPFFAMAALKHSPAP